jgi:signal transduction histidine kinase
MSDRPTPETDALITLRSGFGVTDYEWRQHSRKLERQRDEARELARELRDALALIASMNCATKLQLKEMVADMRKVARDALAKAKEALP